MSFKHKFSYEDKLMIVEKYITGEIGFREACRVYGMNQSALKDWRRLYETFGPSGLMDGSICTRYVIEDKKNAVLDYLEGKLTVSEILIKYKIRSTTQLRRWIKKYNCHEGFKSHGRPKGVPKMTNGRKTTFEERVAVVSDCIANNHNYGETAEKYKVSYQQVYTWVKKYEKDGIEGLKDLRGRTKPEEEMSELEKVRYENRLLKAKNLSQQMEIDFLKKLEEIERRRF